MGVYMVDGIGFFFDDQEYTESGILYTELGILRTG